MICFRSNLIRLQFADMFGSILLVVLGVVENCSTLPAINHNRVMDVSTGNSFGNTLDLVVGEFSLQGLEDIDFGSFSKFFVCLFFQFTLQVRNLGGEFQSFLKVLGHLGVELLLGVFLQNLSLNA